MYGASKMGAEGLVSAFVHLYDMQAWILRPANIIGPRATHGVVFDFIKRLQKDGTQLNILGDGKQSKAYLHVDDVIDAFLLVQAKGKEQLNFFNLSSSSFITVNEIADLVIAGMGLKKVKRTHTAGKIGWKGRRARHPSAQQADRQDRLEVTLHVGPSRQGHHRVSSQRPPLTQKP